MALRLFLSLVCLIGASSPAFARDSECFNWLDGGCGIQASYNVAQDTTRWTMNCGGNWYYGRMGGDQTNALCYGSGS